jgi:nicotinamide mononucleotide (NMN) deamidase PncC
VIRVAVQLQHFRGDRDAVRRKTVRAALQGLLTV